MPLEFISDINRPVEPEWRRSNGYALRKPNSFQIGFIRFNQSGPNTGKFTVYVNQPFSDPQKLVEETMRGKQGKFIANPTDTHSIAYATALLKSAWDQRQ